MQFKVPQFIDVEDKLFGPFSFAQFSYLIGGAGIIFVIYKLLPLWIGIFIILPVAVLTFLLVFYRINNKPFIYYLQASINYALSNKLYVWKQRLVKPSEKKDEEVVTQQTTSVIPTVSSSKLSDISWSLDIQKKEQ